MSRLYCAQKANGIQLGTDPTGTALPNTKRLRSKQSPLKALNDDVVINDIVDKFDVVAYQSAVQIRVKEIQRAVNNQRNGIVKTMSALLLPWKDVADDDLPEAFKRLSTRAEYTLYEQKLQKVSEVTLDIASYTIDNLKEKKEANDKLFNDLESMQAALETSIGTLRAVRQHKRSQEANDKRTKRSSDLKFIKPFIDNAFPEDFVPYLQHLVAASGGFVANINPAWPQFRFSVDVAVLLRSVTFVCDFPFSVGLWLCKLVWDLSFLIVHLKNVVGDLQCMHLRVGSSIWDILRLRPCRRPLYFGLLFF
jgi:uncharacterized protein YutE (UPF0331/DUF86 family)